MKKTCLLICAAVACAATACVKDGTVTPNATRTVEIAAVAEPSRTTLAEDNLGTLWEVSDRIGVWGVTTVNAPLDNQSSAPAAKTTFSGEIDAADEPLYAFYPYSSEQDGQSATALTATLPDIQTQPSAEAAIAAYDFKAGYPTDSDESGVYAFSFEQLMSLLRVEIDAGGTALAGDRINSITLAVEGRKLAGCFSADIVSRSVAFDADAASAVTLVFGSRPELTAGTAVKGWIVANADAKSGDRMSVTIETDSRRAAFTTEVVADMQAGAGYCLPFTLSKYDDLSIVEKGCAANELLSFSLLAACNEGKILSTELYYNGSATTTRSTEGITFEVGADRTVTGCIPYLYDFDLAATFTLSDGATAYVGQTVQESGVTVNDFSQPVTYRVVSADGQSAEYVVRLTNSGLPVVVLEQLSTGDTKWAEAGLNIWSKTSDWQTGDIMTVYNADGTVDADRLACGFRLRGNSTQGFPKKPFAIKLGSKSPILGMKTHKRWCLLANWIDRSLIRNGVAFDLAGRTEDAWAAASIEQGLIWNPHGVSVELVYNGRHLGNYFLCEQIKIGGKRLDITDCYEDVLADSGEAVASDPTNCGYLIEFDDNYDENCKFVTSRGLPCQLKDDVPATHLSYVQNKVTSVENYLKKGDYTSAYELLDINSVIDQWFIFELTMNDEYRHPKSVYMYIDGAGKLSGGPVWDFDYQTFPDFDGIRTIYASYGKTAPSYGLSTMLYTKAVAYDNRGVSTEDAPYMWYPLLLKDPVFVAAVKSRWAVMKPYLQQSLATVDELGAKNKVSAEYNFAIWPMESQQRVRYSWFVDYSGDERMTYDEAVANMKTFLTDRINAMQSAIDAL